MWSTSINSFLMFQSTHSLRSATDDQTAIPSCHRFQSTHSLRSATRSSGDADFGDDVSIHALLAECDPRQAELLHAVLVSIHALLAECDNKTLTPVQLLPGFNPRTPCGVRLRLHDDYFVCPQFQSTHSLRSATLPASSTIIGTLFQSTHSLRSATPPCHYRDLRLSVSIHALLAECDFFLTFFLQF